MYNRKREKTKDGTFAEDKIHFPDYKFIASKEWRNTLDVQNPVISDVPVTAITSTAYGILPDMRKSLGKNPIEFQKTS